MYWRPRSKTILIECAPGKDIREEVARFAVRNDWGLLEMKPVSMTLEDVFLRLTQHEDGLSEPDATTEFNQHRLITPVQAIIAKELRSYFVSPIVYVVGGVFLLTFGFLAYLYIASTGALAIQLMQIQGGTAQINLNDLVFRNLFTSIRFVLLLILPILTMCLVAEERKLRTFEFFMTAPVRTIDIVVGKFVSVYSFLSGCCHYYAGPAHPGALQRFRLVSWS